MAGLQPFLHRMLAATLVIMLQPARGTAQQMTDSTEVVAAVTAFHEALARGDSLAALAMLADDAVILEAGGIESRAEYRSHHLPADIAFVRAVLSVPGPFRVVIANQVAWATSTSTTDGTFEGRPIHSQGAELMVLSRSSDGWRIRAIHWSSRARRRES